MKKCVTIVYPNKQGAKFDWDYYLKKHTPMWAKLLGENKIEIRKGVGTHNGSPVHFICLLRIWVDDVDAFMTLMKEKGHHIIEDIPHYTNVEPVIQFDDVLVEGK